VTEKAIALHKLEVGQRLKPARKAFSLSGLMDDLEVLASGMPGVRAGVRTKFDIADELRPLDMVVTDRAWIFIILVNFLSNAYKHMREGVVDVRMSLRRTASGTWLHLQVADMGTGVPLRLEESLFTPYAQASKWSARYLIGDQTRARI